MQPLEFSERIAQIVEALRELRGIKQFELSEALGIDRSNYSRIENGHRPFNMLELKTVAGILNISVVQIVVLADSSVFINGKLESLSELLLKFLSNFSAKINNRMELTGEELEFIFQKIRGYTENKADIKN